LAKNRIAVQPKGSAGRRRSKWFSRSTAGLVVAAVGVLIAVLAWLYPVERDHPSATSSPPAPSTRVESGRLPESISASPSSRRPGGNAVAVMVPRQGRVGLQPTVKIWGHAPLDQIYVVMIQAVGSEWYPTQCAADPDGDTSTCGGARFGTSAKKAGSWNMIALLLTAKEAQELLQDGAFYGDINDVKAVDRSPAYHYWR